MRMSNMLINTLREVTKEIEPKSHELLLRAGMMRKIAYGIYNFMPMGIKVIENIEAIVREEMDNIGCQEIMTSSIIPLELVEESSELNEFQEEIFKIKDRNDKEFCIGTSLKEVFMDIARNEISMRKNFSVNFYEIKSRIRDERRPRFGPIKSREFIIKEAYSFDKDYKGLELQYNKMKEAYKNIFKRCSLEVMCVNGGLKASKKEENLKFMIKSEILDERIAFCPSCFKTSCLEITESTPEVSNNEEMLELKKIETPEARTIGDLVRFFNTTSDKFAKTIIYRADDKVLAVMVRGDREVSEEKVKRALGEESFLEMADSIMVKKATGAEVGFAGPIGIRVNYLFVDEEVKNMHNFIVGGNETGYHYCNVNYERDFKGELGDFRKAVEGDRCKNCGKPISIVNAIELGSISKLGVMSKNPFVMGRYLLGITRIMAAIIEQNHDEDGIIWPVLVAPYKVIVIPAVYKNEKQMKTSEEIYKKLKAENIDVILDDRNERAGVKFKDADLMGIPIRITVGRKIEEGKVEFKKRSDKDLEIIDLHDIIQRVREYLFKDTKIG
ncbi:proline--tRNA ligase [Haloimpatiens sp. FM7315]|uniref:proline--tRNA ligase n=1 Tax=Haloimpatiens sp. FM7315 TaxID=3298609 RepID=UPI0035A285EF